LPTAPSPSPSSPLPSTPSPLFHPHHQHGHFYPITASFLDIVIAGPAAHRPGCFFADFVAARARVATPPQLVFSAHGCRQKHQQTIETPSSLLSNLSDLLQIYKFIIPLSTLPRVTKDHDLLGLPALPLSGFASRRRSLHRNH
jgi:hypothetical protein